MKNVVRNYLPQIDLSRCNRCGLCVSDCPEVALIMTPEGPIFKEPIICTYCTSCEKICPLGAIRAPLRIIWGSKSNLSN